MSKKAERIIIRRLKPNERISAILNTTRQFLSETGYESITTAEIAARCGVSEATLFKYFASKRDLLQAVAEQWFSEIIESIQTTENSSLSTYERLRRLIFESLSILRNEKALTRFILMELRADPAYRSMHVYMLNRKFTGRIFVILEDGIARNELRSDISLKSIRNLVFGGIEHQTWSYLRSEGDFDVDTAANEFASVIYQGMALPIRKPKSAPRRIARIAPRKQPARTTKTRSSRTGS